MLGMDEDDVECVNILLLGPTKAGKTSFFNTINSVFRGHISLQGLVGEDDKSLTMKFKKYPVFTTKSNKRIRFRLCECRGLEDANTVEIKDIEAIVDGHIKDGYTFKPDNHIKEGDEYYERNPQISDRIHVVVFVIDSNNPSSMLMSGKVQEQIWRIKSEMNKRGIPQIVLMNKVDLLKADIREDVRCLFKYQSIKKRFNEIANSMKCAPLAVFPMCNYTEGSQTNTNQDILALYNIQRMLQIADDYLTNFKMAIEQGRPFSKADSKRIEISNEVTPFSGVESSSSSSHEKFTYGLYAKLKSKSSHKDEVLEELIRGTDVNIQNKAGKTPLHIAVNTLPWYLIRSTDLEVELERKRTYGDTALEKIPISSMNEQDKEGNTALHIAVGDTFRFNVSVLKKLVRTTDVNIQDNEGSIPLHIAAENRHTPLPVLEQLMKKTADVNLQNKAGNTALHIGLENGSTEFVKIVLEHSANLDIQNKEGRTPLHIAAKHWHFGYFSVYKELIRRTNDVNIQDNKGRTPLHFAAKHWYRAHSSVFEELIRRTNDVNIKENQGKTAFQIGVEKENTAFVKIMLKHSVNLDIKNEKGRTPLHLAAKHWHSAHSSVFEELIRRINDVNIMDNEGNTAVHIAMEKKNIKFVKIMLEHSANLDIKNKEGRTPLHLAATHWYCGDSSELEELIRKSKDVNIQDNKGNTAVHIALEEENTEFVEIMLEHSANLDIKNEEGRTPLHLAAKHWYYSPISGFEKLIRRTNDVNIQENEGRTPLHLAAIHWRFCPFSVSKELIRRTNDVNIQDNNGNTALHIAFIKENEEFIKSALISPARLDVKNNKHDTVLDLLIRAIANPVFVLGKRRDFVICLLKALICRKQYEHLPKIFSEVSEDKDAVINTILDYTLSEEMLKGRASCIHVPDVEQDVSSNNCFIQSCLGLSSVANYIDDRDRRIAALFKRTVSCANIRGIQVCLRAVVDISREDILQSLSDAAWTMKNLELVKCIINLVVLTKDEIDEITRPEGKQDDSNLTPDITQVFSDLEIKSSVLERFVSENRGNLIDAYFGRDNTTESNTSTLVAIFKCPPFKGIPDTGGFPFRFTHAFSQYKESIEAEYGNGKREQKVDEDVVVNIKNVISNKVDYLMKNHRNLNIVRRSSVISKAKSKSVEEGNCILLSCYVKGVIPDGDLPFPTSLEGTPVDVREGAFNLYAGVRGAQNAANVQTGLKMGCMISKSVNDNCGTMGGFVTEKGHICFMTCSHVLQNIGACENNNTYNFHGSFDVMEAGFNGNYTKCGEHIRSLLDLKSDVTIDASLIKVCPSRRPNEGQFRYIPRQILENSGFDEPPVFNEGECRKVNKTDVHKLFMKIGAVTGITRGHLEVFGTAARIRSHTLPFNYKKDLIYKGQYEIFGANFATFGDSGALVFSVDQAANNSKPRLTCIGMVVGGASDLITLVTPIEKILEKMGLNTDKMAVFKTDGDMEVDV